MATDTDDRLSGNSSSSNSAKNNEQEWGNYKTSEEVREIIKKLREMYGLDDLLENKCYALTDSASFDTARGSIFHYFSRLTPIQQLSHYSLFIIKLRIEAF
jgi:hypothetical protein